MGTRADFYVGRGEQAEWLGSIAWDGYPGGFEPGAHDEIPNPLTATTEAEWRSMLAEFCAPRDDVTLPEMGWPWPWEDSGTTDYAYALDEGRVWASSFGRPWFAVNPAAENCGEPLDDDGVPIDNGPGAIFPDMSQRKVVTMGKRSGLIVFGVPE